MAEARRLIEQGGVYVDGKRASAEDLTVALEDEAVLIQVGKRRFVRVRGNTD